ncbi:hypothetical protein Lepto7375DRAFT_1017 [Leptolyngbya sp. PCC 7375]|nr:hypothetical protein Lepto7375DRAFT_1017 [Leptolyngbya sp. PCC 7375]
MRYNERRIYLERLWAEKADLLRQLDEIEQQIRLTILENIELDEVDTDSEDFLRQPEIVRRPPRVVYEDSDTDSEDFLRQPEIVRRPPRVVYEDSDTDSEDFLRQPEIVRRAPVNVTRINKQNQPISKSGSGIGGVMATLFLILLAVAFCAA